VSMMVQARGLRVAQGGAVILEIEDLKVEPGETLAVIGPNGAGKSTLLKALALLQRPTGGEILLDGVPVNYRGSLLPYRRRLALVMQQPLLRDVSTFENVATGLRFRGTPRREARERVEHWLGRMGIAHLAPRRASTLSGGEAQRASLARALVLNPDLMLLDEPFADLDPPTRDGLLSELKPILRDAGATTIFVTHDRDEALRLGDRLAVLIRGRLRQAGLPHEVLAHPENAEVASFVGTQTILPGVVVGEHLGVLEVQVAPEKRISAVGEASVGSRVLVCLRPEEVTLFDPSQLGQGSARNRFLGTVMEVADIGLYLKISLDAGFPLVVYATRASVSEMGIASGGRVAATFKATAVHLIHL